MKIDLFERDELHALICKARTNLDSVTNPEWKLAYQQFILACSTLDAFLARSSVPNYMCNGEPLEIGTQAGWPIDPLDPKA